MLQLDLMYTRQIREGRQTYKDMQLQLESSVHPANMAHDSNAVMRCTDKASCIGCKLVHEPFLRRMMPCA